MTTSVRRGWIVSVLVLCGCGAGETAVSDARTRDLEAIEELHRIDREASLAGDGETLLGLWSDDPVALPPGGPVLEGRDTMEAFLGRVTAARSTWETVEYEQEFGEVEVLGEYAWDWGTYRGRSRNRDTGEEVASTGKLLRILKRAPDGSWKVHRSIWNVAPTAPERSGS